MRRLNIVMVFFTIFLFNAPVFAGGPCVHHVVLFDLKDDVTPEQVEEFITVGEALISQIPGVQDVSLNKKAREDRNVHVKDYDVALYVRWENNEAGNIYGPHPLHQTVLKLYKSQWAGVKIIDFYGK
jgi:hypothetical protein